MDDELYLKLSDKDKNIVDLISNYACDSDIVCLEKNSGLTVRDEKVSISVNDDYAICALTFDRVDFKSLDWLKNVGSDNIYAILAVRVSTELVSRLSVFRKVEHLGLIGIECSDLSWLVEFGELSYVGVSTDGAIDFYNISQVKPKEISVFGSPDTVFSEFCSVVGLETLTVIGCKGLESLSTFSHLETLRNLNIHNSGISCLDGIDAFPDLELIDVSHTAVSNLSSLLNLKKLKGVRADNCKVMRIPHELFLIGFEIDTDDATPFPMPGVLSLSNNPINFPPLEIVNRGREAMLHYYDSLQGTTEQLNEAKLVLVGEGAAGKTTLVERFVYDCFNDGCEKTEGIAITSWNVPVDDGSVKLHCWDFGGQEIMRATHQLFLSERSIYLVVLDGRKDENPERWLKQVTAISNNSPIFMVSNKIDEHYDNNITQQQLRKKYPQIVGFFRVSCKTGEGIIELKKKISEAVSEQEVRQFIMAKNWLDVKKRLEALASKEDHISYSSFKHICTANKIYNPEIQDVLLSLLHDLGIVIHFSELSELDTQVLNPSWITEGIYTLINSSMLAKQGGVISGSEAEDILLEKLDPERYRGKSAYLMRVMEQFELCYRIVEDVCYKSTSCQKYLIPDLLPTELDDNPEVEGGVTFLYKYEGYMPPELMARFIVKSHVYQVDKCSWRYGVLLQHEEFDSQALITQDKEDRVIRIQVVNGDCRQFLAIVRHYFSEIHKAYQQENIGLKEFLPLTDESGKESLIPYEYLLKAEKRILQGKERDIQFDYNLDCEYSVTELLNGIQLPEERKKHLDLSDVGGISLNINNELTASPSITQQVSQKSEQSNVQETSVSVTVEIKVLASSLKNWSEEIIEDLSYAPEVENDEKLQQVLPRAERELERVNRALEDISEVSTPEEAAEKQGQFTRVLDFISDSVEGNNKLGKLLQQTGEGVGKLQSLGKQYNKIAQYFALPTVPDVLLSSKE